MRETFDGCGQAGRLNFITLNERLIWIFPERGREHSGFEADKTDWERGYFIKGLTKFETTDDKKEKRKRVEVCTTPDNVAA